MQSNGGNMSMGDKVIMSAIIGGTAEPLGGGKPARRSVCGGGFANNAVTESFVYLLNHAAYKWHPICVKYSQNTNRNHGKRSQLFGL